MNIPATTSGAFLHVRPGANTLARADGLPFFWLGDTAWLINVKLDRTDMLAYLDDRANRGFTVIQVMGLHSAGVTNAHGNPAFPAGIAAGLATALASGHLDPPGSRAGEGYWETLDFLFAAAADRGLYIALVPVWGTVVQEGHFTPETARIYASLLAARYRRFANLIWLNGGDIRGSDHREVWEAIGATLRERCPDHPMTFHPFGRTRSATWFHQASWLDFNMFQSGHRDYRQRTPETEVPGEDVWHGEDNWRYVLDDLALTPAKPTLDGEPSYEDIPHGLHDTSQPLWNDADCRRYAWWALLAGAFGHTYGHNSVMQFQRSGEPVGAYGATRDWRDCLSDPGAVQMGHVRTFMAAFGNRPFRQRPDLLAGPAGEAYERRLAAEADPVYLFYSYSGGTIIVSSLVPVGTCRSWWFDPRTGAVHPAAADNRDKAGSPDSGKPGKFHSFTAPGPASAGNDWLLVNDPASLTPAFDQQIREAGSWRDGR